jgi:hypothetical protein
VYNDVQFNQVNNSSIYKCNFIGGQYGIQDQGTEGNNAFTDNSFDGNQQIKLEINNVGLTAGVTPLVLEHCNVQP